MSNIYRSEWSYNRSDLKIHGTILFTLVGIMWVIELFDFINPFWSTNVLGITPRSSWGLIAIFLSPFLHGSISHVLGNTIPFLLFGGMIMMHRSIKDYVGITLLVTLISGLGIWLFGRTGSVHIGASGVVFGYFGFLLAIGYYERSFSSMFISLFVFILYGGLIFGVLPGQPGISWEGHLFGFLGGIYSAYRIAKAGLADQIKVYH